jgi:hypothetical protein
VTVHVPAQFRDAVPVYILSICIYTMYISAVYRYDRMYIYRGYRYRALDLSQDCTCKLTNRITSYDFVLSSTYDRIPYVARVRRPILVRILIVPVRLLKYAVRMSGIRTYVRS